MKSLIQTILPPILLNFLKRFRSNKYGWKGNYKTWQEAESISTGYDDKKIIMKVRDASLKVKNGYAVYERDSVLFDEIQYSWPLLTGIMYAFARCGEYNILDYGGSLGTTYYQNRKFLNNFKNLRWNIVEQKAFVDIGVKEFQDNTLKFFYNLNECVHQMNPKILILSGVLQYLPDPIVFLKDIIKYNFKFILIDRTPFSSDDKEKIKLQVVPPEIYRASYPCRFFSENKFIHFFLTHKYNILEKFDALDGKGNEFYFKGMILEKKVD
jgi:putative methyltransferase (TIGR04325 family)